MLIELENYLPLTTCSISLPNIYLDGKVSKIVLPYGVEAYAFNSSKYSQECVNIVKDHLEKKSMKLCV